MRRTAAAVLAALSLVACNRAAKQPEPAKKVTVKTTTLPSDARNANVNVVVPVAPPVFLDRSELGAELDKDGNVSKPARFFRPGQTIYLTMWLKESPAALQTSARWTDVAHSEIADERRPMNGAKVVTFALKKKLKPGDYRVEGFWGGNSACEYGFKVEGSKKKSSS